jgi:hypothetical protein
MLSSVTWGPPEVLNPASVKNLEIILYKTIPNLLEKGNFRDCLVLNAMQNYTNNETYQAEVITLFKHLDLRYLQPVLLRK